MEGDLYNREWLKERTQEEADNEDKWGGEW